MSPSIDFREIYRRYHRLVWWVVRSAGVPEAWIEDVVHDAFLAIHRRLPELDDPTRLRPRVIGIARNAAFSHRRGAARRHARQSAEPAPEEPSAVDSLVAHRQAWDQVRRFLDELDDAQREAFVLCELQGMEPAEVAHALQVSRNTVYSRLRLARAKLLDHFSERPATALPDLVRTASRQGRPTREQQQRTWAALAVQLPLGPAASAGAWLVAGKAALVSVGLAALTLGVVGTVGRAGHTSMPSRTNPEAMRSKPTVSSAATSAAIEREPPRPVPPASSLPIAPSTAAHGTASASAAGATAASASTASPSTDASAASSPVTTASTASPSAPLERSSPPSLDDDIELLQRAAQQLERGLPSEALATLEDHARAHPDSVLAPERLGLRVRALCIVGSTEQARALAARHVAEHPGTRLAAALANPCGEAGGTERSGADP